MEVFRYVEHPHKMQNPLTRPTYQYIQCHGAAWNIIILAHFPFQSIKERPCIENVSVNYRGLITLNSQFISVSLPYFQK
jgi:hypothetical protein